MVMGATIWICHTMQALRHGLTVRMDIDMPTNMARSAYTCTHIPQGVEHIDKCGLVHVQAICAVLRHSFLLQGKIHDGTEHGNTNCVFSSSGKLKCSGVESACCTLTLVP
jgi:hypothetical protein